MKKATLYVLITITMLVILGSCHQSHKKELDLAYVLAESNPDSALSFLNHINQNKLSEKDMANMPSFIIWHKTNRNLRQINKRIRETKLPGNSWRVQDPGHFHIKKSR